MNIRKIIPLLLIGFVAFFASCRKDPIINTADQVGISRVTYYPVITLNGSSIMSVVKGTAFSDPGATAKVGTASTPVTVSSTLNTGVVGLYIITYSATNPDGFSATATRTVFVIPTAEVAGVDLSGNYSSVGTSPGTTTVTKVAAGVYYMGNVWNGGTVIPGYFISSNGTSVTIPLQSTPYGRMQTDTPGTYTSTGLLTWNVDLLDQGPLVRTRIWQKI